MKVVTDSKDVVLNIHQMVTFIGQLQVVTGEGALFDHVDEGLPMWSESGDRSVEVKVRFKTPFLGAPGVIAHIIGMDSACDSNQRYWLNVKNVGSHGFSLKFNTWGDTRIARVGVSWQAIGQKLSAQ